MKITLCQINPVVGDVFGNASMVCNCVCTAAADRSDLVLFPELVIQGYPPQDLLEQRWFIDNGTAALERIVAFSREYPDIGILVGMARPNNLPHGKRLFNSAVLISNGEVVFIQDKSLLPTYDVFYEARYFDPACGVSVIPFKGEYLGITICEDAWINDELQTGTLYGRDPVADLVSQGATLLINIASSPFHIGKENLRASLFRDHAARHGRCFLYVNQVGGNDELIFDGNSMVFDKKGQMRVLLPSFSEAVQTIDTAALPPVRPMPDFDTPEAVRGALVLGIRDYMRKCGFSNAVLGLSGGIDSALTAALAKQALGPENVWGVALPSRYSSQGSVADARTLAENLGIRFSVIPIEKPFNAFLETLTQDFAGTGPGLAEENLQARIRGTILMALSNKFNRLLLTTGNKSELAVGYCTLYGDMNGGLSVISDLPKNMVYRLATHINDASGRKIIPESTLCKPPSAELRPDQTDQDTLPPYPVLDDLLEGMVEKGSSQRELVESGFDEAMVKWVGRALVGSEYKRRQAAPGLKVTPKAFGLGRRFPVAARFDW
jgi:NAD+ synthase (glutamine-hydrolysing)